MGLIETRLLPDNRCDSGLPPASTYRLFYCHCCLSEVDLCSRCDRGNIYCAPCAPERKAQRIRRARSAYLSSLHGKSMRAAAEKRRRLRRQMARGQDTVGDRGSPVPDQQGNTTTSEHVSSDSGVPAHEDSLVPDRPVDDFRPPPAPQGFIRCSNCYGLCEAFQIQGPRGRRYSRRPRSRSPTRSPSHGGRTS